MFRRPIPYSRSLLLLIVLVLFALTGCVSRLGNGMTSAVLNNPDPATVRQGLPAYLLLIDGLIQDDPTNEKQLVSASSLYALASTLETTDLLHRQRLAERSWQYGVRAVCRRSDRFCTLGQAAGADFTATLQGATCGDVPALFALGAGWLARLQADYGSFQALAELPRVEALFARLVELDELYQKGGPQLYLGILRLQRPPSLGGAPEQGRFHLERAIELSAGRNLEAKVELARLYARMLYDRDLHDRLLHEVLAAEPMADGLTLFNVLAQEEARSLLDSADDYFP